MGVHTHLSTDLHSSAGLDGAVDLDGAWVGGHLTDVELAVHVDVDSCGAVHAEAEWHTDGGGDLQRAVHEHEALGHLELVVTGELDEPLEVVEVVLERGQVHVVEVVIADLGCRRYASSNWLVGGHASGHTER